MVVEEFVYIASLPHSVTTRTSHDIICQCHACAAMQSLDNHVWRSQVTNSVKLRL